MNWVVALPLGQRLAAGKPMTQKQEAGHVQDDVDLMLRVKAGDADAFNQLMDKYQRTVVNLIYRFTGDAENAEDLAQEVFLRIYRAAPRYEPKAKFFTYLYQVTLNLCRNERERNTRRKTSSLDSRGENDRPWDIADPEAGAETQMQRQETASQVQAAILELPQEQRQLLILQRFQELGYEELAELTSQTVSAVKAKLHRARLALKKKLEPLLGKEPDR
ncbi:MAG: sigma-70 family RNA polymerase sigma factor [Vulcanimicrobiota bacterium]